MKYNEEWPVSSECNNELTSLKATVIGERKMDCDEFDLSAYKSEAKTQKSMRMRFLSFRVSLRLINGQCRFVSGIFAGYDTLLFFNEQVYKLNVKILTLSHFRMFNKRSSNKCSV